MNDTDAPPFPAPPGARSDGNGGWFANGHRTPVRELPIHSAVPDGEACPEVGRYLCTEQSGHGGWHIATTIGDRVVGVWRS